MALSPAQILGRRGGLARAEKMTKEARSTAARQAVQARWRKRREQGGESPDRVSSTTSPDDDTKR